MRYLRGLLEHILIYQASGVMGDNSGVNPSEFFCNPGGRLGIDRVCSPGFEPYKICKLVTKHFKNPRELRIIGYPHLDWLGDTGDPAEEEALAQLERFVKAMRGRQMEARSKLEQACKEFGTKKRKRGEEEEEEDPEYAVMSLFGWPVRATRDGAWYSHFVASLCPINMRFRQLRGLDVTESYDCFCLNMGALPPLALCLLRCCLLYDGTNSDLVLLRELDVPWDLALVTQRYYTAESKTQDHIAMPGCQLGNYRAVMNHIKGSVEAGDMSPYSAVQMLQKVVRYGLNVFKGMAEAGAFLSDRVMEAVQVMKNIEREEMQGRLSVHKILQVTPPLPAPATADSFPGRSTSGTCSRWTTARRSGTSTTAPTTWRGGRCWRARSTSTRSKSSTRRTCSSSSSCRSA